jgi:hypothetical protein
MEGSGEGSGKSAADRMSDRNKESPQATVVRDFGKSSAGW